MRPERDESLIEFKFDVEKRLRKFSYAQLAAYLSVLETGGSKGDAYAAAKQTGLNELAEMEVKATRKMAVEALVEIEARKASRVESPCRTKETRSVPIRHV